MTFDGDLCRRLCLARDCISDRLVDAPDLRELGLVAGMSPHHLLRVFRQVFGETPHEYLISGLRMIDGPQPPPARVLAALQLLGQRPFAPGSPAGWADTADRWDGPDALLKRIEWASVTAQASMASVDPLEIGTHALGGSLTEHTRTSIRRAASAAQGATLLLVSPEFKRR